MIRFRIVIPPISRGENRWGYAVTGASSIEALRGEIQKGYPIVGAYGRAAQC